MRFVFLVLGAAACAHEAPVQRVQLPVAPVLTAQPPVDEGSCKAVALTPVGLDSSDALDTGELRAALESARDFAERCCSGDESGTATVLVTVSPEGYATEVKIEPDNLADGPTGSCLYGSFHRVTTRAFRGTPMTVSVDVRVNP